MRWFVVFLLIANIVFFFWVQQDALRGMRQAEIPPPDIGRLRLLNEPAERPAAPVEVTAPKVDVAATEGAQLDSDDRVETPPVETPAPVALVEADPQPAQPPAAPPAAATEIVEAGDAIEPEAPAVTDVVEPSPAESPAADSDAPTVVQAETPASDSDDVMVAAVPADEPAPIEPTCARVGPLVPSDADALLKRLPRQLTLISDTSEEVAVVDGYYVLIPALPDRAAGRAMLAKLSAAGFDDTWLFRRGELRNAISLGMFRRGGSAQRHADRVSNEGFNAVVQARTSPAERRWLQFKDDAGGELQGTLDLPSDVELTPLACPQ